MLFWESLTCQHPRYKQPEGGLLFRLFQFEFLLRFGYHGQSHLINSFSSLPSVAVYFHFQVKPPFHDITPSYLLIENIRQEVNQPVSTEQPTEIKIVENQITFRFYLN